MAYNPFDDVIEQDPAYMQEGGDAQTTDQRPGYYSQMFKGRQQPTKEEATSAAYENIMTPLFNPVYQTLGKGITQEDLDQAEENKRLMQALQDQGIMLEEGFQIPEKGSRDYYN